MNAERTTDHGVDPLTRLVLILMVVLGASVGLAGAGVTTVSLLPTVRMGPEQAVTLGAIARIDGAEGSALSGLSVPAEGLAEGRWTTVDADAVRRIIEESGAKTGSVVVVGARVSLTRLGARAAESIDAVGTASVEPDAGVVVVRDHIESWLCSRYSVESDDLRMTIDERDRAISLIPTENRVVEIQSVGTSSRMVLRVRVYERDRIVDDQQVRLTVEIRTRAAVLTVPMRRGARVEASSFEVRSVWSNPVDPPADVETIVGQVARRAMNMGEVIRFGSLEPAVLVHRGQEVSVRMVQGSVVVTSRARARHDAMEGELVELEAKDRSGRRFTARVAGPGRTVMIDPQEAQR